MNWAQAIVAAILGTCVLASAACACVAVVCTWLAERRAERRGRDAAKTPIAHRPIPAAPLPLRPLPAHLTASLDAFGTEYAELLNAYAAANGPSTDDVYAVLAEARDICRTAAHTDI